MARTSYGESFHGHPLQQRNQAACEMWTRTSPGVGSWPGQKDGVGLARLVIKGSRAPPGLGLDSGEGSVVFSDNGTMALLPVRSTIWTSGKTGPKRERNTSRPTGLKVPIVFRILLNIEKEIYTSHPTWLKSPLFFRFC